MKKTFVAGSLAFALGTSALFAMEIKWAAAKSTQWLANGQTALLRGNDLPGSVTLQGVELTCTGCFLAPVSGTASDLDTMAGVPSEGYGASLAVGSASLAAVKFDDGTYAKLAVDSTSYDAGSTGQNAGVTITSVLAERE